VSALWQVLAGLGGIAVGFVMNLLYLKWDGRRIAEEMRREAEYYRTGRKS
jgi:hypothetical protein